MVQLSFPFLMLDVYKHALAGNVISVFIYDYCYDPCLLLCMIMADVYSVNCLDLMLCILV